MIVQDKHYDTFKLPNIRYSPIRKIKFVVVSRQAEMVVGHLRKSPSQMLSISELGWIVWDASF